LAPTRCVGANTLLKKLISVSFLQQNFQKNFQQNFQQNFQELVQEKELPKKQQLLLNEHEKRLRLMLSKNLALALMAEGDSNNAFFN
jgi:hypothetical protein